MRLGQFARKYDIRVQDIISYLEKGPEDIHSNTKLSDESESDILDFFGIEKVEEEIEEIPVPKEIVAPIVDEPIAIKIEEEKPAVDEDAWIEEDTPIEESKISKIAIKESASPLDDIASVEGEIEFHQPKSEDTIEEVLEDEVIDEEVPIELAKEAETKPELKEDEVIDTDRLMEMIESEEPSPDLDKIKLIKAAKKELSGLKVLGKVDLPEPKKKEEKEEEKEERPDRNRKSKQTEQDDDNWEERRIIARAKREKNEARVAKLKKEKEERERVARNAVHYKQKLGTVEPKKKKLKAKKEVPSSPEVAAPKPSIQKKKSEVQKEQPKSAFGKAWKWLTSPDK